MRYRPFLIVSAIILSISCKNQTDFFISDVSRPVIDLNGTWEIHLSSFEEIPHSDQTSIKWGKITVPGECMMQGFPVKHNEPFTYKKVVDIPSDFKGKIIKLRFEGVYSYARVWVNNIFIRDHSGGFTAWECDITSAVQPGKASILMVEVTDRSDEISYASGYAKHQIGGILRDVSMLALPDNYPEKVIITTDLDENYKDATLIIEGKTRIKGQQNSVELDLYDPNGRRVKLQSSSAEVAGDHFRIANAIKAPFKWDAEHPNLYRLRISFKDDGHLMWVKNYTVGFREVEIKGNKFLVNGMQIKLRGVCRHDIHPLLGRISTPEYDLKDVLLAKEANVNFIRTSHYPPSERFLDYCDKYGIFVEDETAVCFVGSHRTTDYYPGSTENMPDFTGRYLSQLEEMVSNHRNHPSVIFWSIGNENVFGSNFKKSYDWVKNNDLTRPVIFSYPGKVPDSIKSYDILSMHYPGIKGNMNQFGLITTAFGHEEMPVIFDEWAHVACYNNETVIEDPNIRDFWGMSLDSMWHLTFEADGGLGGAIWGMIDETFMLPADLPGYTDWWGIIDSKVIPPRFAGPDIGYGEWGIIDTWRRKKPEFWSVTKAYSPVRVLTTNYEYSPDKPLEIPVYNRFDFTNLNEISIRLKVKDRITSFKGPDILPHCKGIITAEIDEWPADEKIYLEFTDEKGNLIDSYSLTRQSEEKTSADKEIEGSVDLSEDANEYIVICNNKLKIGIDRLTGLFTGFENSEGKIAFSGPYANIRILGQEKSYPPVYDLCNDWKMGSLSIGKEKGYVRIELKGSYESNRHAKFITKVYPDGTIFTAYSVNDLPEGKLREAGIKFIFGDDFDSLKWKRKTYWSMYPEDHLSGPEGNVPLYSFDNKVYRKDPGKEWHFDKKSFYYEGIESEKDDELINAARSTKENVITYHLTGKHFGDVLVTGKGEYDCRIEKKGKNIILNISNEIDYPDLGWGNYSKNITISGTYTGEVNLSVR